MWRHVNGETCFPLCWLLDNQMSQNLNFPVNLVLLKYCFFLWSLRLFPLFTNLRLTILAQTLHTKCKSKNSGLNSSTSANWKKFETHQLSAQSSMLLSLHKSIIQNGFFLHHFKLSSCWIMKRFVTLNPLKQKKWKEFFGVKKWSWRNPLIIKKTISLAQKRTKHHDAHVLCVTLFN